MEEVVLDVIYVVLRELMVLGMGFLTLEGCMVSAILYLGDVEKRPLIQLSHELSF